MNLAPLPVTSANPSGKPTYNRHQNCLPSVFGPGQTQHCSGPKSHPALNGAMGCLPGDRYGVDREVMNNTLHETLKVWEWGNCWGWDQVGFPSFSAIFNRKCRNCPFFREFY